MAKMQRNKFICPFTAGKLPRWKCPNCENPSLIYLEVESLESTNSISFRKELYKRHSSEWYPDMIRWYGTFIGVLKCKICLGQVAISGYKKIDWDYEKYSPIETLTPTYFNPPIHIFDINGEVPNSVRTEIVNAFKLYWLDQDACANKIRRVVEAIMDDKVVIEKHRLDQRIKEFEKTNSEKIANLEKIVKYLHANRVIGNDGSHHGKPLTKEIVLDGFELLMSVINDLYGKDNLEQIAERYYSQKA